MFSIRNKNAIINFFVSKTNEKTNKNLITLYKLINHALFKTIWDRYAMHYIFYIIISPVNHSLSLTNISKFNFTGLLHLHAEMHQCMPSRVTLKNYINAAISLDINQTSEAISSQFVHQLHVLYVSVSI